MMLGGIACLRRRWWAQHRGAVKPRPLRRGRDDRIATALAAARYQVIPSSTAAMAAATTAIVAVSTVTARADHRNSRSRRACETAARGKAEGIAGRISTRIRIMLLPERSCAGMSAPQSKERQDSNPVPGGCGCQRRCHKRVSSARRVLRASSERRVNARPPAARTGNDFFQSRWRVSMTVVPGPGKSSELRPVSQ
jgi:hypothetical protein